MSFNLKDRIRQKKRKGQPFEVPEWGETVHLRKLSAREVLDLRAWIKRQEEGEADEVKRNIEVAVRVVALSVVDEHGNLVFGNEDTFGVFHLDECDKTLLECTDQGALERIFQHVMGRSGQTEEGRETIRKNSEAAAGASPAASPSPTSGPTSTPSSTS